VGLGFQESEKKDVVILPCVAIYVEEVGNGGAHLPNVERKMLLEFEVKEEEPKNRMPRSRYRVGVYTEEGRTVVVNFDLWFL
jgi:hypothetical protein